MRKVIILLIFISSSLISKSQNPNPYPERYVPTVNRTKYELPLWLYGGAYLSSITKKSNQMQVLVRDSVSQLIGYKYISAGGVDTINISYSAPLRRNGNTISVPLTKNSNMNRVLVQDSVTGYFSYKYLTAATTYSAGRGLTLGGTTFRLDTTRQYRFTNGLLFGSTGAGVTGLTGSSQFNDITLSNWATVGASSYFQWNGRSAMRSSADGSISLSNQANDNFTLLILGAGTSAFPSFLRAGKKIVSRLADNSANTNLQVKDTVFSTVWNGQIDVPTKNAVYDQMILKVNYTDTATMLSKYLRSADTLKLRQAVNLRVKYTDTSTMLSKYLRSADTLKLHNQVAARVKYTDTATMLSPYVLESYVYSGTWTPTLTNLANCGTLTARTSYYIRTGDVVVCSGMLTLNVTTIATPTSFSMSLPISSNFTDAFQSGGSGIGFNTNMETFQVQSEPILDKIIFQTALCTNNSSGTEVSFQFAYKIN